MRVYVDSVPAYTVSAAKIDTYLTMSTGAHYVIIQAWDSTGAVFKSGITISVASTSTATTTTTTSTTSKQYYVSKAGSDSNSGTQASPWKTIQHAAGVVAAGSTVNVLDGVYYESVMISHSGTATAPIIFRSQNKWGAKIVGTKATTITIAGDYVQIREFDITNEYTGAAARDGIRTTKSHIVVAGNHIHDIQIYSSCDYGAVAVDQGGYSTTYVPSDLQVLNNVMDHIGKIGQCSVLGKKDHGYGIYFAAANSVAMNNIIFDNGAYGINTWHAATNLTIVNNSIFHNGRSGILVGMGDGPWSTGTSCGGHTHDYSKVYNNIVYDNAEMGIREYDSYRGTCVGSHNTYYDNLVYANKNGNVTLYAPHTASGTVAANPAFANYLPTQPWGTGDYHLQFTSPAKNHGTSQSAPTIDFDGGPRPIDSTWDIGAYEWGTTP